MINSPASIANVALVSLSLSAAMFGAAAQQHGDRHHTVVYADSLKWGPAPSSLPPGAQAATLLGSPAHEGPFVLRLKFPAGFTIPPHRHSKDEFVTVVAGEFSVGAGETMEPAARPLAAGSFVHLPAGMPHYAVAVSETVVQINGVGPFDVNYISPNDDPRTKPMN